MPSPALPPALQALVDHLILQPTFNPAQARRLLLDADLTADDLMPWADFDHPAADSYGRKLVYDGGFFELMVMSWLPGDMAAIHDHGHAQWGAVRMFGPAEHAVFQLRDGRMTTADRWTFATGDVVAVGHDLIHQMGNQTDESFLSLHLYGAHGREGDITADARLYDFDSGQVLLTGGGVFFDLPAEATTAHRAAPKPDFATWLRHQVELLRRLLRMDDSLQQGHLGSAKARKLVAALFSADTWTAASHALRHINEAPRPDRHQKVLVQELRAAAELQQTLLETGLAEAPSPRYAEDLDLALAFTNPVVFTKSFTTLLRHAFDLPLVSPEPVS